MIGLIIATAITGYFTIGAYSAWKLLPRRWEKARLKNESRFPSMKGTHSIEGWIREDVMLKTLGVLTVWPVMIAINFFTTAVDSTDPRARKREMDEREQHIRDLERELGIR
ncbi:hypothetical protein [Brevibacterium oceani]|uniref:hypothetical protein n=1 Tax=Brevibacterium oceani TaxID=358099 RepID=UPI0015E727D5|nr:hypothetical protein [Brevibacterium oceani]